MSEGGLVVDNSTDEDLLDQVLQRVLVAISGLPTSLVRIRWAREPLPQPNPLATPVWVSSGIGRRTPSNYPSVQHNQGVDYVTQQRDLEWLVTCYGDKSFRTAETINLALHTQVSRLALYPLGIAVAKVNEIVTLTELVNAVYIKRCDISIELRQEVSKGYAVYDTVNAPVAPQIDNSGNGVLNYGTINTTTE